MLLPLATPRKTWRISPGSCNSSHRTVEELEDFLDELNLRTRKTVWPHERRQLDVVQTSLAKKNGKLVTQLVLDRQATLHVCSYRRRRTGCFFFGMGFNG